MESTAANITTIEFSSWQTILLWLSFLFLVVLGALEVIAIGYSLVEDLHQPIERMPIYYLAMFRVTPMLIKIIGGILLITKKPISVVVLLIAFASYFINNFLLQIYESLHFGGTWESAISMLQVNLYFILYSIVYLGIIVFAFTLFKRGGAHAKRLGSSQT